MTCEEARRLAWLGEDGEAPPVEAGLHLASCDACRAVVGDRLWVREAYRSLSEPVPGAALRARVEAAARLSRRTLRQPRFWAAAAAAALLLAWVPFGREPAISGGATGALVFDAPRESIESRIGGLEWEVAPDSRSCTSYTTYGSSLPDRWGIGVLRQRIEKLEKALEAATPDRPDPGRGAAPETGAAGQAC